MTNDPSPSGRSMQNTYHAEDLDMIYGSVAAVERTQNARDPEGFMKLLANNIVWVTAFGKRITGWDEVNSFTRKVLTPALGNRYSRYEIESVMFLGDGVAAVHVHQSPVNELGQPDLLEPYGRPLYIMTKFDGAWLITVAQNTRIQGEALAAQSKMIGEEE